MTTASNRAMELAGGFSARHGAIDLVHSAADLTRISYRTSEQAGRATYGDRQAGELTGGLAADVAAASSTSVFDPVLCELAYRWFSPPDALVFDPFAGGSVRGVVASALGRRYVGIDLSERQIAANKEQLDLCAGPPPTWICGDSRDAEVLTRGMRFDFIFTCPPYADLERYSDDPNDLSTLDYPAFKQAYAGIIAECAALLKDDSFACFVVGDVRGKDGNYYGFPADTAAAFKAAGMFLYNEAILVTAVGSLPVRINGQFNSGRKLGKTHQNVLVFLKGNAKRAAAKCGEITQAESGARQDAE